MDLHNKIKYTMDVVVFKMYNYGLTDFLFQELC